MNEKETHECTACSCDYTDDEGGVQGYFGIMLMSFCPTCLSSIFDMVDQLNPREWVGLTDDQVNKIYADVQEEVNKHWDNGGNTMMFPVTLYQALEAKLKEENGFE